MNKEEKNKNFDLNAKYKDMIQTATKIVEYNLNKNDNSEPKSEICFAYDVKNYLPQLLSQIDQQDQIIREAKELCRERIDFINAEYDDSFECCVEELGNVLKILDRNINDGV